MAEAEFEVEKRLLEELETKRRQEEAGGEGGPADDPGQESAP